jgi:hypothetical protein
MRLDYVEDRRPLDRPTHKWEDNIEIDEIVKMRTWIGSSGGLL